MEKIAPASIRSRASGGISPTLTPSPARMNENSPICARLAEIVKAVETGWRNPRTIPNASTAFPSVMMRIVATSGPGCSTRTRGLNSIPTETKNSTANASRRGSVSCAARWLSWDSDSTIPAKNAPSANDMPNSIAAP